MRTNILSKHIFHTKIEKLILILFTEKKANSFFSFLFLNIFFTSKIGIGIMNKTFSKLNFNAVKSLAPMHIYNEKKIFHLCIIY